MIGPAALLYWWLRLQTDLARAVAFAKCETVVERCPDGCNVCSYNPCTGVGDMTLMWCGPFGKRGGER